MVTWLYGGVLLMFDGLSLVMVLDNTSGRPTLGQVVSSLLD